MEPDANKKPPARRSPGGRLSENRSIVQNCANVDGDYGIGGMDRVVKSVSCVFSTREKVQFPPPPPDCFQ